MAMPARTAEGEHLNADASNYDPDAYPKPGVTVDVALLKIEAGQLKVLLIQRKHPPFAGRWAIPGGFVDIAKNEPIDVAARRELEEETGLKNIPVTQFRTYGDPGRDPRMRMITVAYCALAPAEKFRGLSAGSDAAAVEWFPVRRLPAMAFDHDRILKELRAWLAEQIAQAPVAFQLLPARFTWEDLRSVFEIVLGRKLKTAAFKRAVRARFQLKPVAGGAGAKGGGLLRFGGVLKPFA